MIENKPALLTPEGLKKLKSEYDQLITVGREEVADRLHAAFEDGQDDDFVGRHILDGLKNLFGTRIASLTAVNHISNSQTAENVGQPISRRNGYHTYLAWLHLRSC